ncbi:flagellar hook-length control protein FliK [Rhodoplanes sp. SY1]|uniref:flagellar hook-length control protein FliK n=1 Tax=Rhodoplanes sp. SY1 TaxID=3166646 RepID=UPI0038B5CACD
MPTLSIDTSAFAAAAQAARTAARTTPSSDTDFASLIDDAQDVAASASQDAQTRQRATDPTGTPRSDAGRTPAADRSSRPPSSRDRDTAPTDDPVAADEPAEPGADATTAGGRPVAGSGQPGSQPGSQPDGQPGSDQDQADGDAATADPATVVDPAAAAAAAAAAATQATTPTPIAAVVDPALALAAAGTATPVDADATAPVGEPVAAGTAAPRPVGVPTESTDGETAGMPAAAGNAATTGATAKGTDTTTAAKATEAKATQGTPATAAAATEAGPAADEPTGILPPETAGAGKPESRHAEAETIGTGGHRPEAGPKPDTRPDAITAQPSGASPQSAAPTAAQVAAAAQGLARAEGLTITGTAQAGATQVTTGRGEASAPVPLAGVPVEITAQAKNGKHSFEIRLDPPDLGRVHVKLEVDGNGTVVPRITADRADTLELLRRDAGQLERALQDAGLKADQGAMQFSLRDQSGGQQYEPESRSAHRGSGRGTVEGGGESGVTELRATYGRLFGRATGVDIRV